MQAAGAYIRALREKNKLTRARVADLTGTSVSQLVRIENGVQNTRATLLSKIVEVVKGDVEQVQQLLASTDATPEDGRRLAEEVHRAFVEEGGPAEVLTPEDKAEWARMFEEELASLQSEERRQAFDQVRSFLAGWRASRRRSGG